MSMRMFKNINHSTNAQPDYKPTKHHENGQSFIQFAPNSNVEFLNRVNEQGKTEILNQNPGLIENHIFKYDLTNPNKPYKIILGEGRFSKARLAKINVQNYSSTYVAIRKIKSQDHISSDKEILRDDVIKTTTQEFKLQKKLTELNITKHFLLTYASINMPNNHHEQQLYQCLPLADMGNGNHLLALLEQSALSNDERALLYKYIAVTLLQSIATINEKNFFHRDIKPANILFTSHGKLWISDFGSAAYYENQGDPLIASRLSDTCYKPPYALLDELDSEQKDRLLDSWSLALTLLQFYNLELYAFIELTFFEYAKVLKKTSPNKEHEVSIHTYTKTIAHLKSLPCFKQIPAYLQSIILNLLELDLSQRQSISQLIKPYEKEFQLDEKIHLKIQNIFKKVIESANDKKPLRKTETPAPICDNGYTPDSNTHRLR